MYAKSHGNEMIPRQSHWRKNLTYHLVLQYPKCETIGLQATIVELLSAASNIQFWPRISPRHMTPFNMMRTATKGSMRTYGGVMGWLNHAESHSHCQVSTGQSEFHRFKIASFMKDKLDPWLDTTRGTRNDLANSF